MNKRGFTLVEVTIVVAIISILATISISTYAAHQTRAAAHQAKALASSIKAGSEQYYNKNNEYPSSQLLHGGTPDGSMPASYQTASNILKVSVDQMNSSKNKFIPCANSCTISNKSAVYYLTKPVSAPTSAASFTSNPPNCTFTLPASDNGSASFIIIYWNGEKGEWNQIRSNYGNPATSDWSICSFS